MKKCHVNHWQNVILIAIAEMIFALQFVVIVEQFDDILVVILVSIDRAEIELVAESLHLPACAKRFPKIDVFVENSTVGQ